MKTPPYINIVLECIFRYNANIGGFFMRKIFILLLFVIIFLILKSYAYQYEIPVCITFNGEYIDFADNPQIIDGTTYLPVRFFCEALDATVDWQNETKTVTVNFKSDEIIFNIGSLTAYVNGTPETINGTAKIIDGKTYLPVRFIVESRCGSIILEKDK